MFRDEFEQRMRLFHVGDWVRLVCRGNYGDYISTGRLIKVENGWVYLHRGKAHSYRRIRQIQVCLEEDKI